jgi:hypothetical protein
MNIYQPYTYLIGWSSHNKWYYGVRFAKNCHPSDFWKSYFTSSKKVKSLRKQIGDPDVIQIRKTFLSAEKARIWESKVIKRMGAPSKPEWLNQSDHNYKFYHEGPRGSFSEGHRKKLSEAAKNRKRTPEHIAALHAGRRASKNSPEHTAAILASRLGSKHSEETRNKMSQSKKNNINTKDNARKAGLISVAKRPNNYKEIQSFRMKQWWADRKLKNTGG